MAIVIGPSTHWAAIGLTLLVVIVTYCQATPVWLPHSNDNTVPSNPDVEQELDLTLPQHPNSIDSMVGKEKRYFGNINLSRGALSRLSNLFKERVDEPPMESFAQLPKGLFDSYLNKKDKRFFPDSGLTRGDLSKLSSMFKSKANNMDTYAAMPKGLFDEFFNNNSM